MYLSHCEPYFFQLESDERAEKCSEPDVLQQVTARFTHQVVPLNGLNWGQGSRCKWNSTRLYPSLPVNSHSANHLSVTCSWYVINITAITTRQCKKAQETANAKR